MKKSFFLILFMMFAFIVFGQHLQKGNLVGVHVMEYKLEPGATDEQFVDFYINKIIPVFEKYREGWKVYPVKWQGGEKSTDGFKIIIVIGTVEQRNLHFNKDGSLSEFGKTAIKNMQPVFDELSKLGTFTSDKFTDWVVF